MALERLRAAPGIRLVAVSRLFETEPVGPPQGRYLNAAAELESALSARALLELLLSIERQLGRTRGSGRDAARTLDLDLLLFGDASIDEPGLVVPHPRLAQRAFVLEPLAEIAGDLRHPRLAASICELAAGVRDLHGVRVFATEAPWP